MTDEVRDFRAYSDHMLELLDDLRRLEEVKRMASLGSDELVEMAREMNDRSRLVFRWAGLQLDLAQRSREAVRRGDVPRLRIVDMAAMPLDGLLAQWREAQLRFELAKPGSPEAAAAADDIERLRESFHAAQDAKWQDRGAAVPGRDGS
jgi:hypothetical protein